MAVGWARVYTWAVCARVACVPLCMCKPSRAAGICLDLAEVRRATSAGCVIEHRSDRTGFARPARLVEPQSRTSAAARLSWKRRNDALRLAVNLRRRNRRGSILQHIGFGPHGHRRRTLGTGGAARCHGRPVELNGGVRVRGPELRSATLLGRGPETILACSSDFGGTKRDALRDIHNSLGSALPRMTPCNSMACP